MKITGDQQLVKRINRSIVLRLLFKHQGASRADISQLSGLTKSTVSQLVREMLDEHWLEEFQPAIKGGVGRPSTPVFISREGLGFIGLEVAVDVMRLVCTNALGDLWHAEEIVLDTLDPEHISRLAAQALKEAQALMQDRGARVIGIGVGIPGTINDKTGVTLFAPNLNWREVDFKAMLQKELLALKAKPVPLYMHNDADAAALGEYEFGDYGSKDNLIFISCDVGVGAGIVLNDHLFSGAQGMAGEIGHSIIQIDGPQCSCGRLGCVEAFVGFRALQDPAHLPLAGRALGITLQNLWTTFNPSTLVVGGKSCFTHPQLVERAQDTLNQFASHSKVVMPKLRLARFGLMAAAVGSAALVLHQHLRPIHT